MKGWYKGQKTGSMPERHFQSATAVEAGTCSAWEAAAAAVRRLGDTAAEAAAVAKRTGEVQHCSQQPVDEAVDVVALVEEEMLAAR